MLRPLMSRELTQVTIERLRGDGERHRVSTSHRGPNRAAGDFRRVAAASALGLGAGLVATGTTRALLVGLGAGLLYVAIFLALGELLPGRRARPEGRRDPAVARPVESPVLRVMSEVMHVRPEPFSGRPERPDRAA